MTYTSHFDLPYVDSTSPRQALDLYLPEGSNCSSPLLIYIHGGAWRSDAKEDFRSTIIQSLVETSSLPVACIEYRLAPDDPHPAQILDVISALSFLQSPLLSIEDGVQRYSRTNTYLIGHSAGAFMAATLVLHQPTLLKSPSTFPAVPIAIRQSIKGIICAEGIYDLTSLLEEYPTYDYFVHQAFGTNPDTYKEESPTNWELYPDSSSSDIKLPPFLILHSKDDELISMRQPKEFVKYLYNLVGSKEEVVKVDYESLNGTHEDLLKLPELAVAVNNWVKCMEEKIV